MIAYEKLPKGTKKQTQNLVVLVGIFLGFSFVTEGLMALYGSAGHSRVWLQFHLVALSLISSCRPNPQENYTLDSAKAAISALTSDRKMNGIS